jgi:hypothetical protein
MPLASLREPSGLDGLLRHKLSRLLSVGGSMADRRRGGRARLAMG